MSVAVGIIEHFSGMEDPRADGWGEHLLIDILFIALCTVLCGGSGFTDMHVFGKAKEEWLRKYLKLPHGIPSHDTFGRVLSVLDPVEFEERFMRWSASLAREAGGKMLAIDGKTLRHSFDTAAGQPALHLLNVWATENGIALGHIRVDPTTNEITALPRILEMLDINGCTVTIDAIGCQRGLAEQIVSKGGDYVLAVKANQPDLLENVKRFFAAPEDRRGEEYSSWDTVEKDHGRVEVRKVWALEGDAGSFGFGQEWKGLRSIAAVYAERTIRGEKHRETRYFISSLPGSAKKIGRAVRGHWGIENSLHHVLDVTMNEDSSRVRKDNAPENLATLRRIALNTINKAKGKSSTRQAIKRAGWDEGFLERLLVG